MQNAGPITSLAGDTFYMQSASNHTQHTLGILKQTDLTSIIIVPRIGNKGGGIDFIYSATFTGTWDGVAVSGGKLTWDAQNNVMDISFTWGGGTHSFTAGKVLLNQGAGSYGITGTVKVQGGGGPGAVQGNEVPFMEVTFHLVDQGGTPHTLVIQSQTNLSTGVTNFNGTWDGPNSGTGTLTVNASGIVTMKFSWEGGADKSHKLTATLTPEHGGLYELYGNVTVQGGGGPGTVSGLS